MLLRYLLALIAFAGSHGSVEIAGLQVFLLCGILAFCVQWLCFIPAYLYQTEHYFDLVGSLTYISLSVMMLVVSGGDDTRTVVIASLVIVWATRLGTFLFKRIRAAGEDRRFRVMKTDFFQFLMTWTIQGLWVFVTYAAGLAAMSSGQVVAADSFLALGVTLWVVGFAIEVVADGQKSAFKADPNNADAFITNGLWSWSRHPNYFGEILLWLGIAVIAFPVLQGWQLATLISPVFVVVLLTAISGVRMLEARANRKWGDDQDYQAYKRRTSVLFPFPPSR